MSSVFSSDSPTQFINIQRQPTFDLQDWQILEVNLEDKILFCQSTQVFEFDRCKGSILARSKILRLDKIEAKLVKNLISAVIDAGFVGKLCFKVELTKEGIENLKKLNLPEFQTKIANIVQIDLFPFGYNYYQGSNQTNLQPDIKFTPFDIQKPLFEV